MLQQIKPRNARSKRAVESKEPKPVENPKKALFLRGTTSSEILNNAVADLVKLRQPHSHKLQKKNDIHPFNDASSLEFLSEKNDASILVFCNHSKKRPHTLTLARTFDYKMLDMQELHVDHTSFMPLENFKGKKVPLGLKPILSFSGSVFEDNAAAIRPQYAQIKSFFVDYFTQTAESKVDVAGLQYTISISGEEPTDELPNPPIHFRAYIIKTYKPISSSGSKTPRVEVEEMGPRLDFRIGRRQTPDPNLWREAMRRPRDANLERKKKNVETDLVGDKMGRIHLGRQDIGTLQSRKMKGLKRNRDHLDLEDEDIGQVARTDDVIVHGLGSEAKRMRSQV